MKMMALLSLIPLGIKNVVVILLESSVSKTGPKIKLVERNAVFRNIFAIKPAMNWLVLSRPSTV